MAARELLVDDGNRRRGFVVLRKEATPREKRYAEAAIVVVADPVRDRDRSVSGLWLRLAFDRVVVVVGLPERKAGREASVLNSGQRRHFPKRFTQEAHG